MCRQKSSGSKVCVKGPQWSSKFYKNKILCVVSALFVVVTFSVFHVIYWVQPTPYLDEVFHIPQAELYCKGKFNEWDSKITTLPGLYLLSVGLLTPVSSFLHEDVCGTYALRMINVFTACVNFYLLYNIQKRLRPEIRSRDEQLKIVVSTLNLTTFPVLYFFTFLYYTDAMSTCLVLLTYLLHLNDSSQIITVFTATLSILVRQSNIMWVGFIGQLALIRGIEEHLRDSGVDIKPFTWNTKYLKMLQNKLGNVSYDEVLTLLKLIKNVLNRVCGFVIIGLGFIFFVLKNDGIVVGDRTAHQFSVNIPQIFYFAFFVTVFAFPYVVCYVGLFLSTIVKYRHRTLLLSLVLALVILVNTQVHPYLLADNRHYTFYIWKRLYERHSLIKYALIPVYIFGMFVMHRLLDEADYFYQLGFILFGVFGLIPQKLLEFRYFIVPFIMLRLQYHARKWWQLVAEFLIFTGINVITVYLFVTRTFYWPDSDSVQRFLW